MRLRLILGWLVLLTGLFFSGQSFASTHANTPKFVEHERLVEAMINMDVFVEEHDLRSPQVASVQPAKVAVHGEILVMNPHGHIHWYKPYFNHTHFNKASPNHTHWYIDDYVTVDTLEQVKPIIVAATIGPDDIL